MFLVPSEINNFVLIEVGLTSFIVFKTKKVQTKTEYYKNNQKKYSNFSEEIFL